MTEPEPAFYTRQQVAEKHNDSLRHVDREIASGRLKVHRFGRAVRISAENLQAYEDSCEG